MHNLNFSLTLAVIMLLFCTTSYCSSYFQGQGKVVGGSYHLNEDANLNQNLQLDLSAKGPGPGHTTALSLAKNDSTHILSHRTNQQRQLLNSRPRQDNNELLTLMDQFTSRITGILDKATENMEQMVGDPGRAASDSAIPQISQRSDNIATASQITSQAIYQPPPTHSRTATAILSAKNYHPGPAIYYIQTPSAPASPPPTQPPTPSPVSRVTQIFAMLRVGMRGMRMVGRRMRRVGGGMRRVGGGGVRAVGGAMRGMMQRPGMMMRRMGTELMTVLLILIVLFLILEHIEQKFDTVFCTFMQTADTMYTPWAAAAASGSGRGFNEDNIVGYEWGSYDEDNDDYDNDFDDDDDSQEESSEGGDGDGGGIDEDGMMSVSEMWNMGMKMVRESGRCANIKVNEGNVS